MKPGELRFVSGGERGRLLEFARRRGRSFTLGEACREADLQPSRELMATAHELVVAGLLRQVGPAQFKYQEPPEAPENQPLEPLPVSPPRSEVEKKAPPVVVAPPSAPTPPPSAPARVEAIASAARRQRPPPAPPPPDTPARAPPRPKEKPMPVIPVPSALERARALRGQQEQVVEELQSELGELEARAGEIRAELEALGALPAPVLRNGDVKRRKKARVEKPAPPARAAGGGPLKGRLIEGSFASKIVQHIRKAGKPTGAAAVVAGLGGDMQKVRVELARLASNGHLRRTEPGKYEAVA
jgi:hypothetical protein